MPDHPAGSELRWWHDTLTRLSARCQHASAALAAIPALIDDARARPCQPGPGHALAHAIDAALTHLDRITAYTDALADPGPPICTTCQSSLGIFIGHHGWQHWRVQQESAGDIPRDRIEIFTAGHPATPGHRPPIRPDWDAHSDDAGLPGTGCTPPGDSEPELTVRAGIIGHAAELLHIAHRQLTGTVMPRPATAALQRLATELDELLQENGIIVEPSLPRHAPPLR